MKKRLSHQEFRVAKLLALGYTRPQVCSILDIGKETLRTHEAYIRAKTGLGLQTLWMLFLPKNKKYWPLDSTRQDPKTIRPWGVLDIDRFDLRITLLKSRK